MANCYARTGPDEPTWRLVLHRGAAMLMATAPVLLMLLALLGMRFDPQRRIEDTLVLIALLPAQPAPAPVPPPERPRADPGGRPKPGPPPRIDPAPGAPPRTMDATAMPAAPPLPVAPPLELATAAPGAASIGIDLSGDAGDRGRGGRGTGAGTGSGSGADADEIWFKPSWVRQPTDEDLARFAPAAMAAGVSGEVVLACRVRLSRSVEKCEVLRESPAGKGFGQASLAASRIFRVHPPRRNGKPVDRGRVAIPIEWVSLVPPPTPPAKKR